MKQSRSGYNPCLLSLFLVMALGGCISMPKSPTPRFYTLQAMDKDQAGKKFNIPSVVIIGIGPVKIPEYLNRPQIVTQDADNLLTFAQFDRWGEPLDLAMLRAVSENIALMLPNANLANSPWDLAIPVKYQVIMDVGRLESRLDQNLVLTVQWSVIDLENNQMALMKKSEFSRPIEPRTYSGLARTLSLECAALSAEIAEALAALTAPLKSP